MAAPNARGLIRAFNGDVPATVKELSVWQYTVPDDADYAIVRRVTAFVGAVTGQPSTGFSFEGRRGAIDGTWTRNVGLYSSPTVSRSIDQEMALILGPGEYYRGRVTNNHSDPETMACAAYIEQVGGTYPGTIAQDTFTDTDETLLSDHTSDTGDTWAIVSGGWKISGNAAKPTSTTDVSLVTFGSAVNNCIISAEVTNQDGLTLVLGYYVDGENFFTAGIINTVTHPGNPFVGYTINNTATNSFNTDVTYSSGTTYLLEMQVIEKSIILFVDGAPVIGTVSDTLLSDGVAMMRCSALSTQTVPTFDSFTVRDA